MTRYSHPGPVRSVVTIAPKDTRWIAPRIGEIRTMGEVIPFPQQPANINREIDKILDQSLELKERSEALLEWAEEMLKDNEDKD